jgi:pantothenate synthetase
MSSRNLRLSPDGRTRARALSRGLRKAVAAFDDGERDAGRLAAATREVIEETQGVEIEYVEVMDADRITPVATVGDRAVLAIAARVEGIRLIDNAVLGDPRLSVV